MKLKPLLALMSMGRADLRAGPAIDALPSHPNTRQCGNPDRRERRTTGRLAVAVADRAGAHRLHRCHRGRGALHARRGRRRDQAERRPHRRRGHGGPTSCACSTEPGSTSRPGVAEERGRANSGASGGSSRGRETRSSHGTRRGTGFRSSTRKGTTAAPWNSCTMRPPPSCNASGRSKLPATARSSRFTGPTVRTPSSSNSGTARGGCGVRLGRTRAPSRTSTRREPTRRCCSTGSSGGSRSGHRGPTLSSSATPAGTS